MDGIGWAGLERPDEILGTGDLTEERSELREERSELRAAPYGQAWFVDRADSVIQPPPPTGDSQTPCLDDTFETP